MPLPDSILEMPTQKQDIAIGRGLTFQLRRALGIGHYDTTTKEVVIDSYVDLTGVTPAAYIVDQRGAAVACQLAASVIAPATGGWVKISAAPAQTGLLIVPPDADPRSGTSFIGRWMLTLTDSAGNVVEVIGGDVTLSWNSTGAAGQ